MWGTSLVYHFTDEKIEAWRYEKTWPWLINWPLKEIELNIASPRTPCSFLVPNKQYLHMTNELDGDASAFVLKSIRWMFVYKAQLIFLPSWFVQKHFWLPWKLVLGVTSLCLLPLLIINAAALFPWSQIDLLYFLATRHIIWQLFTLICIFHLLSPHITCNNVNPRLLLGIWVAYYLLCSVSLPV